MIYLKTNPVGIDVVINDIQISIANALGWTDYDAYSRAYKNYTETGIIPEVYKTQTQAKTGEYKEVLLNDNLGASSFFYTSDTRSTVSNGHMVNTVLSIIFQVDLVEITGVKDSRQDEEIHRLVMMAINKSSYGKVNALITSIPSVYSDFNTSKINLDDIQPYHCFRVDIDVSYQHDCQIKTQETISDIGGNLVVMI